MAPALSIVVVLYNSADVLADCLRTVTQAVSSGWAELICVDNASPDESVEILKAEMPDAGLVRLEANGGFAAGVNAGVSNAAGRYWLLLNPDTRVPEGGLRTLVDWMERHEQIGVASPDIRRTDGVWQAPGRALPSLSRSLLELSRLHRALPSAVRGRVLRGPYWTDGDQLDAGWVPGTAMIVRASAGREVGPMREDLFMYGEDVEYCWRMRQGGWQVGVCASTTFVHQSSSGSNQTFGEVETDRRSAAGLDAACRLMYGPRRARALAAVTAVGLAVESRMPRRDADHRSRASVGARIWGSIALRR